MGHANNLASAQSIAEDYVNALATVFVINCVADCLQR
jgi:hypothetical protein